MTHVDAKRLMVLHDQTNVTQEGAERSDRDREEQSHLQVKRLPSVEPDITSSISKGNDSKKRRKARQHNNGIIPVLLLSVSTSMNNLAHY